MKRLIDIPAYKTALAQLCALQRDLQEAQRTRAELHAKIAAIHTERGVRGETQLDARARALVRGDPTVGEISALREQLATITDQELVIERAIKLQQETLERLRVEASRAICAEAAPQHRTLGRRIARAVRELADACDAEIAFRRELTDLWVETGSLPGVSFPAGIVRAADPNSRVGQYLLRLLEVGVLESSDLPQGLIPRKPTAQPSSGGVKRAIGRAAARVIGHSESSPAVADSAQLARSGRGGIKSSGVLA